MKISKEKLQGIIKEELNRLLAESEEEEYLRGVDGPSKRKSRETSTTGAHHLAGTGGKQVFSQPKTQRYTGSNAAVAITSALAGSGDAEEPMSEKEAETEAWKIINMYKQIKKNLGDTGAKKAMVGKLQGHHPELAQIVAKITHIDD